MISDETVQLAYAQKILSEDAPKRLQFEIAKSSEGGAYAYGLRLLAPWMIERMKVECQMVGIQNQQDRQATKSHVPECRIPEFMYHVFEAIFGDGCWRDEEFRKDTLKHHPELKCKVKYGTKGQEYVH